MTHNNPFEALVSVLGVQCSGFGCLLGLGFWRSIERGSLSGIVSLVRRFFLTKSSTCFRSSTPKQLISLPAPAVFTQSFCKTFNRFLAVHLYPFVVLFHTEVLWRVTRRPAMALGILTQFLRGGRAVPRTGIKILTSKRGPRNYYKGKGCKSTGRHTSKGILVPLL